MNGFKSCQKGSVNTAYLCKLGEYFEPADFPGKYDKPQPQTKYGMDFRKYTTQRRFAKTGISRRSL